MLKDFGKRTLSILLAAVMVFTLLPVMPFASLLPEVTEEQTLHAKAATTVYVLDNQVSITDSQNKITESDGTVTIIAQGGMFTAQTNKITIYNETNSVATLTFTYTLTGIGTSALSGDSASCAGESKQNGTYTYTGMLDPGASVAMSIKHTGSGNVTLVLKDFSFVAAAESSSVTIAYDNTLGRVTAGGSAVANGDVVENVSLTDGVALVATAANGGRFLGWINPADGMILSKETSYTLIPMADTTVEAVFAKDGETLWYMTGATTSASDKIGWLGTTVNYYKVSGTHLFNDLNAAGAAAAASASSKAIVLMNDGTLSAGTYTIPVGVTLLIPFDDANTMYTTAAQTAGSDDNNNDTRIYETPTPYRTLTLAQDANLIVNGAMSLSAKQALGQGGRTDGGSPTGKVSFVRMESGSNITVNNGGSLYAYGFITGSGTVTAKNGATVYECFQIMDFRGGNQSTKMENGVFPLSQYYVQNIEVPLTLEYGATEYSYTTIYMSKAAFGSSVGFIAPQDAMFNLTSGSVTKWYDGSTDRLMVTLNGNLSVSGITMRIGLTDSLNSKDFELPVNSNITLTAKSGSAITLAQDVAFLPGSQIIVEQNATCTVEANVYVYDADQWGNFASPGNKKLIPLTYAPGRTGTRTEATLVDASVLVNGTVNGTGFIYTTAGGANICSTGTGVMTLQPGAQTVTHQLVQNTGYTEIPLTPAKLKNSNGTYLESSKGTAGSTYNYTNGFWQCDNHTWNISSTTEPTCTTAGVTTYTCTVCGATKTESVDATGHTESDAVKENEKGATCTAPGSFDMVVYCADCGVELSRDTVVTEVLTHTPGDAVIENEVPATCKQAGSYDSVVYCTVCKQELSRETETVDALPHTPAEAVKENETPATCTKDGSYELVVYCGICDEEISRETVTVDATGHDYEVAVTDPTCTAAGYTTYTCSVCGDTYTDDEIPALGHTPAEAVIENNVAATCVAAGSYDTVVYCSVCNAEISRVTTTVEATGEHNYVDGVCSDCGAKEPAEEVTGTITANGHSLSLEGNIWINKYVIIEGFEGVDLTKDAGLLIWTSEIAEEDAVFGTGNPIVKEGLLYNGLYGGKPEYGQLTDGIKAPFYGNKLYMRVYVKVGETYHYGAFTAYSVEDYCRGRIQKSSDAALKTLCAAVLEYGAMAQIRFSNVEGVNTEVLVNEGLDSSLKTEFSEEMIVALDTEYETKITAADTAIVSANGRSISLNEGLLINYYFKTTLTNIQSAELLTWDKEVEGELTYENAMKTALTYAGGEYAASGALVPAPYCGDTIYACARFVDAEGAEYYTAVDAYSTHKYAENQFAKANLTEANRNLLEALIVYSHLANTKFAK